ncbi:hypothetical protein [Cricetibacter osteomyelitidis]|nr:hypothetical protein [Cricetibacter osteomyelitidis]
MTNLSVITLVLATGAQFYTNHKIDQTLAQFPYHFTDDFAIYVEQVDKDLFTRDLVFSLGTDENNKTEIISTHLTSFPFAAVARSELTASVVRDLNKKLNVTIDQNVIKSQFSVVGDYMQSTMETQFRDITNNTQSLTTDLNFIAKTHFIEIEAALSGFNYDAVTKFHDVKGRYTLQPLGNHSYDLVKADMNAASVDIKDGENNHYKINKLNYQLEKSFNDNEYDLNVFVKSEKINVLADNKEINIDNFAINSQQQGISRDVTFHDELIKLNQETPSFKKALTAGLDYLLDNKKWQFTTKFEALSVQRDTNRLNVGSSDFAVNFSQENAQSANVEFSANVSSAVANKGDETLLQLQKLALNSKSEQLNLAESAVLIQDYFPEQFADTLTSPEKDKDNVKFIKAFEAFAKNYKPTTDSKFSVAQLELSDILVKDLQVTIFENLSQENKIYNNIALNAAQVALSKENVAFNELALTLPLEAEPSLSLQILYLCTQSAYATLCGHNLSAKTAQKWLNDNLAALIFTINNSTISSEIDTYPKASRASKINATFSGKLPMVEKNVKDMLAAKWEAKEFDFSVAIPAKLVANDAEDSEVETTSNFWLWLKGLKRNDGFALKDENYRLHITMQGGKILINGKDPNEIEQPQPTESEPAVQPSEMPTEQ